MAQTISENTSLLLSKLPFVLTIAFRAVLPHLYRYAQYSVPRKELFCSNRYTDSTAILSLAQVLSFGRYGYLIASLPLLDPFYRVNQHQNVQKQAIPDPEEQHHLHRDEQRQRPAEPEIPG